MFTYYIIIIILLYKYKKQLKLKGESRDDSAKKYTNKICRDSISHPLYIPTLAFGVAKGIA